MQNGIYHLRGIVKHYDWGGFSFIPSLLELDNRGERPFAEYWLGIHPLGPSLVEIDGEEKRLPELEPALPFLLKILDVKDMLSIQVHPSKTGATHGFAEEEKQGILIDSPYRNYKDANHKPELMVALSDFWLLHGFKPAKELEFTLLNVVELRELLPVFNHGGYEGLYKHVMEMPQDEVNRILEPLVKNITTIYLDNEPDKDDEDYWVGKAAKLFCPTDHIDRGIFSIYLLNLVHLKEGEAIFQDAGVPHAYLEGKNIEIMANSDNVLRGGLTNKHIAVDELMKHVKAEPLIPKLLHASTSGDHQCTYEVPVNDFQLKLVELKNGESMEYSTTHTEILLLVSGSADVSSPDNTLKLCSGQFSLLVLRETTIKISTVNQCKIFRAISGTV